MKKVNKEKIILVTGGSGLIGKSIIKDLTEDGYFPINIDITSAENSVNISNVTSQKKMKLKEYSSLFMKNMAELMVL